MSQADPPPTRFAYEAQDGQGAPLRGTLESEGVEAAQSRLRGLGLRVLRLLPLGGEARPKALGGEDFAAFNQHLAQMTAAGLPVEEGLRLVAQEMGSRRQAATIEAVADEMARGRSLGEAFAAHRGRFPPLYGQLIDAGVQARNLPGVLFNFGRHLDLLARLRGVVWRSVSYPLIVLAGLGILATWISLVLLPGWRQIFDEFRIDLPSPTAAILLLGPVVPWLMLGVAVLAALAAVGWTAARAAGHGAAVTEAVLLPVPLLGRLVRCNLVARWCDALRIGVEAGLDLPAAIDMAGAVVASPRLRQDGARMVQTLAAGQSLRQMPPGRILPPLVCASIELGAQHRDLPGTLAGLAQMYEEQAELRVGLIQGVLTPILLFVMAVGLGIVVVAAFLPLVKLITAVTG